MSTGGLILTDVSPCNKSSLFLVYYCSAFQASDDKALSKSALKNKKRKEAKAKAAVGGGEQVSDINMDNANQI